MAKFLMKRFIPVLFVSVRGLSTVSTSRLLDFNFRPWSSKLVGPAKTAILCHGCHLQAEGWEKIVWGDGNNKMGRLPHASMLAVQEKASFLVIGSGGSHSDGETEGEFTLKLFKKQLPIINHFKDMYDCGLNITQIEEIMNRIVICETRSINTVQEIEHACELFSKHGVERIILVSSPTHIARCIRDACVVLDKMNYNPTLLASPSETCYLGTSALDLCVVEPGHRGDRDKRFDGKLGYHRLFPRALRVEAAKRHSFTKDLNDLIQRYEEQPIQK